MKVWKKNPIKAVDEYEGQQKITTQNAKSRFINNLTFLTLFFYYIKQIGNTLPRFVQLWIHGLS